MSDEWGRNGEGKSSYMPILERLDTAPSYIIAMLWAISILMMLAGCQQGYWWLLLVGFPLFILALMFSVEDGSTP